MLASDGNQQMVIIPNANIITKNVYTVPITVDTDDLDTHNNGHMITVTHYITEFWKSLVWCCLKLFKLRQ